MLLQACTRVVEVQQQQLTPVEEQQQQQRVFGAQCSSINRSLAAKEAADTAIASSSSAEGEGLWQTPAAAATVTAGHAALGSDASGLPMDLPLLPPVLESTRGSNSAETPVMVRAVSSGQHRASGVGGLAGPRMRTSVSVSSESGH